MNAGYEHVAIDVEAMISNFERHLSRNQAVPNRCSIFKIPSILSQHATNKYAYIPNAFSIGPFHRDNPHLKPTERIKKKYMLDLISRLSNQNRPIRPNNITSDMTLLRNFTEEISKAQNEAHEYYAEPIEMKTDEFVEMLVLDGCFIIELFRKNAYRGLGVEDDPIFTMSCMLQFLYHDLILLENQIPWFVLDTLFELTKTESIDTKPLVRLAIEFFPSLLMKNPLPIESILSAIEDHKSKHILDLLRNSLICTSGILKRKSTPQWQHIRSATGLRDSGITFNPNFVSNSILDINFFPESGIMSIPPLLIQETTETVFRNLISLEQCCPDYKPVITCYAVLLDNLINTGEDIQLLDHKVIVNWLKIDEVTGIFGKLCKGTYVMENYYYDVTNGVDRYCKRRMSRYRELLKKENSPPWLVVSFILGTIYLTCTFLQTLFTIIKK